MVLPPGRTLTSSPSSPPLARAERILVVDDDPDTRDMCAEVLSGKGYDVIRAESGRSAEALLRTSAVDVTVTDLKMPDVGGLEILRVAKEVDPNMVVILITGFPAVDTAVEGMKFGAAEYLSKPFAPHQLLDVVQNSLDRVHIPHLQGTHILVT